MKKIQMKIWALLLTAVMLLFAGASVPEVFAVEMEDTLPAAEEDSSETADEEASKKAEESSIAESVSRSESEKEESIRQSEEESRKASEEARQSSEEESRKASEEARQSSEEESRKASEEARQSSEEESRKASEEARQSSEEESRKQSSEEESRRASESESVSVSESESESMSESESIEESEKESSSIAESESLSIEESEYQSSIEASSIEEEESRSIEESEEAASHLNYNGYDIAGILRGVDGPEGFILAKDLSSFEKPVEAFYSTDYRLYVYYASAPGGKPDFYMLNELGRSMYPYVAFAGSDNSGYIVTAVQKASELPEGCTRDTEVAVTDAKGNQLMVPGYEIIDTDGSEKVLLYLTGKGGVKSYFVYDNDGGKIRLSPWVYKKSEESSETEVTESETLTVQEDTSESETKKDPKKDNKGLFASKFMMWLFIIGGIILLLIIAIIVVLFMNREQDEEEDELEREEESFLSRPYRSDLPEETDDMSEQIAINVSDAEETVEEAAAKDTEENGEFNISFEDAFPEEMNVKTAAASAANADETEPDETESIPFDDNIAADADINEVSMDTDEQQYVVDLSEKQENEQKLPDVDEDEELIRWAIDEFRDSEPEPVFIPRDDIDGDPFDSEAEIEYFDLNGEKKNLKTDRTVKPKAEIAQTEISLNETEKVKKAPEQKQQKKYNFRDMLADEDFEVIDFNSRK